MGQRVVVVDDDGVSRRGLAEILADRAEFDVTGAFDHRGAIEWDHRWHAVDVAVIDVSGARHPGEWSSAITVVDHIRRHRSRDQTMVVVLAGDGVDPALRRRMREVQADFYYRRTELQEAEDLYRALLAPRGGTAPKAAWLGSRRTLPDVVGSHPAGEDEPRGAGSPPEPSPGQVERFLRWTRRGGGRPR